MSRKDTLGKIKKKRKEIEDLERELKELPPEVCTVDVYLHSSSESMYREGKNAGLSDKQLELFVYACSEVKATLSVDEDGEAVITSVDDKPLEGVKEKYMIKFTDAVGESDEIFTTAISKEEAEEWFNEQFPTCVIVEVEIKPE